MLQDVMLDRGCILGADPVLGGGPDKALCGILVLHPAGVTSQPAVDVAEGDQDIAVVALHRMNAGQSSSLQLPCTELVVVSLLRCSCLH